MSAQERILDWICQRQKELKGIDVEITPDSDLLGGGLLDSLDFLHLITFLEEEFGVEVPVDMLSPENFSTPNIAGQLIQSLTSES